MKSRLRRTGRSFSFAWSAILALAMVGGASSLPAAETSSSGGGGADGGGVAPDLHRDAGTGSPPIVGRGEMADVILRGAVRDASGTALRDVRIQVFEAGQLVGRTTTTSDGTFTLTVGAAPVRASSNEDRSLDLWVLSPDASRWIDERLLVVFDDAKRDDPLIPRCTPIVTLLGGAASVDVMMKSPEERRMEIAKSRCLEARAGG